MPTTLAASKGVLRSSRSSALKASRAKRSADFVEDSASPTRRREALHQDVWAQYENLRHTNQLRLEHERESGVRYTLIIRARLDMYFENRAPVSEGYAAKASQKA